jgi:uncharacterized protein (DUF885 family)
MRTLLAIILILGTTSIDASEEFDIFRKDFLEARWELLPDAALYAGLYDYDEKMVVPDVEHRQRLLAFVSRWRQKLDALDEAALSDIDRVDHVLISNYLERTRWRYDTFREWSWNPARYNIGGGFGRILNTDYKPLEQRLKSFYIRMQSVPDYYAAGLSSLGSVSEPHLALAVRQNEGAIVLFDETYRKLVNESDLTDTEKALFSERADVTVAAIKRYVATLKSFKDDRFRDFRIGAELFEQKFQREIVSSFTSKEIYEKAVATKSALHSEMVLISRELWDRYYPDLDEPADDLEAVRKVIDAIAAQHVERTAFVDAVRAQVPELVAFVIEHDLLEMDASRPLVVRETPLYQRGVAVASINAPGPYNASGDTYYNVTPLDELSEAQAESYLREYNSRTMQILNIHEAVPGHYTQLVYANKSPSRIKRLFGNGSMVEGWAVYAEKMMLEEGYGDGELELTLMYDKWILRSVVNAILDYEIHVNGASEEAIMDLLLREAFQEKTEAAGKWRRATLSQVQLSSYFTGFTEIYQLREDYRAKLGSDFVLKDFHNRFLGYGNAPVKYIRSLMLDTDIR